MNNIAITGSYASGKSFVLDNIRSMGYRVFSCDDYVRTLYKNEQIQKLIEESIKDLKKFDKKELAKIIYSDVSSRKKIEQIIHPKVREAIKDFEKTNRNEDFIFTEIPLLFESGFHNNFSYSICVFCSEKMRLDRAKSKYNFDMEIFEKINKIQFSQDKKKSLASFVINSENTSEEIKNSLSRILESLISSS